MINDLAHALAEVPWWTLLFALGVATLLWGVVSGENWAYTQALVLLVGSTIHVAIRDK